MFQQGAQSWGPALATPLPAPASEAATPLPSLPTSSPCDFMSPNPVARFHKESLGERGVGSGTQPGKEPQLSLSGSSGEEWKATAKTKAAAIPLCPAKRSSLGLVVSPRVRYPRWRKPFSPPYGSGPSPTEFPVPSSSADQQ